MFACFYPGEYVDSTYGIDFGALYAQGYRGIIFDIDNTLVPPWRPGRRAGEGFVRKLKELGFSCCLLSNNKEGRVKMFNEDIGVSYIYNAHKPSTGNYRKACEIMHTDEKNDHLHRRSAVYRCVGGEPGGHSHHSRQAHRSEGGDPDRAEVGILGTDRSVGLSAEKEKGRGLTMTDRIERPYRCMEEQQAEAVIVSDG